MKSLINIVIFFIALSISSANASQFIDYITGFLNGNGDTKFIGCMAKSVEDGPVIQLVQQAFHDGQQKHYRDLAMDCTKFGKELLQYKDQCSKTQQSWASKIWNGVKAVAGLISKALIPEIEILEEAWDWTNVVYHGVMFVQYAQDPYHSHTDYEIGYQAGQVFQYFQKALKSLEILVSVDPLMQPMKKQGPKFQLNETTEIHVQNDSNRRQLLATSNGFFGDQVINYDCKICMNEDEVENFFNGFYDGHLVLTKGMNESVKIDDCVKQAATYQDAINGGLQQRLNTIMISFGHENYERAVESYYELDRYIQNLLQESTCQSFKNLAFSNDDYYKPVLESESNNEQAWMLTSKSGSQLNIISTLDLLSMKNQLFIENKLNSNKAERYQFNMGQLIGVSNKVIEMHNDDMGQDYSTIIWVSVLSVFGAISIIVLAVDCRRRCAQKEVVGEENQQHESLAQEEETTITSN